MKMRVILSVFVFAGATALFVNRSVSEEKPADHQPSAEVVTAVCSGKIALRWIVKFSFQPTAPGSRA